MAKLINGIYIIEKKWDLYWLKNKDTNTSEAMRFEKFQNILFQSFNGEQIIKIANILDDNKKVLIDFDKDIAKVIVKKDEPFINAMLPFFNKKAVQQWYDEDYEIDIYNNI